MAGFEVIVRPVVFPNIRPAPTRSLPPEDNPEQGGAVISGGGGQVIALTHTYSSNASRPNNEEVDRTFDEVRIRPEGADDDDVYIDVEVMKKVKMRDAQGTVAKHRYAAIEESENVTIIRNDVHRENPNITIKPEPR